MINFLLFYSFIALSFQYTNLPSITFGDNAESKLTGTGIFKVVADYKRDEPQKYLYIYPKNYDGDMYINKAIFKIYFKEISEKETETNVNYLDSDYSTLDFNSGLLIKINSLKNNKANIFIVTYGNAEMKIEYRYANDVNFPTKAYNTNLQLNQFILEKEETKTINYEIQSEYNEYLIILTKTSLRNIEVKVKYKERDYTKDIIASLYPNGYSIFIDTKDQIIYDFSNINYYITIKNKNKRDEILLLGFMHHDKEEIFTDKLINGYQMYLESNQNALYFLPNVGKNTINQYFTYQTFSKGGEMIITCSRNIEHYFTEYNSMLDFNVDTNGKISFDFTMTPKRNSLFIQYLDYSEIDIAQKSLQALVPGSPKSMIVPAQKSIYHFLPIERESTIINYYLRSKSSNDQNMFISFKTCKNYPEECVYKSKDLNSVNPINNIGLWFSEESKKNELQIIYIYCQKECAYDILMTYDNDPLFMFPENNYTKFISEEGKDTFILPVFEYLSYNQSINIDLSVISGNAELTLYKNLDKMEEITLSNNQKEIIGRRQLYTISNDSYVNSDYYKKDIYAVVKGDKNTFYNLMYGAGAKNDKLLDNNRVIVESVYVGSDIKKNFTFLNKGENLYISISTPKCKSKINIDGKEVLNDKNYHLEKFTSKGYHVVQIYLIEDELLCKKGQKEEVILYAYNNDNTNILLSENTLVNGLVSEKEITFRHIFKPDFKKNEDNSFSVEIERLSDSKSLKFEYKLEKISFNSSTLKESSNKQFSTFVFAKKTNLISNKQIKEVCDSLDQNEICSLSLTLSPSSSNGFSFCLYLNKNGRDTARHLVNETLINIINQKSIRYYYIDANKDYDTEILINSFGQDLFYKYVVESADKKENDIIPFEKSGFKPSSNYHKIEVAASDCGSTCRIYLGVYAKENSFDKEVPTTFEISYLLKQKNERKTDIKLPLNYWVQYSFDTLSEIVYSLENYNSGSLLLELYAIKENLNDNCEVEASYNNEKFTSAEGSKRTSLKSGSSINIKPKTGEKCRFKFRASSLGKSDDIIVPMLPYSSEKCVITDNKKPCYYALDISPENDVDNVYFYVPETEDAFITIYNVSHGLVESEESLQNLIKGGITSKEYYYKRPNWHEHQINKKNMTLIVGVTTQTVSKINLTLYSSFSNKPEEVTLNQGEKKIFTIEKSSEINRMSLKIKKANSQYNKYKINIHAVKGNGFFKLFDEIYPLGFDYNNKEDITIVIDKSDNDIEIIANNQYNDKYLNDFTFSIDYTITTLDQLFNELEPSKINSYKIIKPGASDLPLISFYMKANYTGKTFSDVNMNVKIFSYSTYEIKAYIVDKDFINEKSSNINAKLGKSSDGEVTSYIVGKEAESDFTFSKIEIPSSKLNEFQEASQSKELYIYVTFSKNDKKNKVRIDIYPYDIANSLPLAQYELFIHKLPAGTPNYQLLLVKSDNTFNEMYIEYLSPSSNKYNYAIANLNGQIAKENAISENETNILDPSDCLFYGKNRLKIHETNGDNKLRYLLFNVFSVDSNKESKIDQFIFKYRSISKSYSELFGETTNGFSVDNSAGVKFKFDALLPKLTSGKSVFIIKAYKQSDIEGLNIDENYLSLYLLFSDIKPVYTLYKSLDKEQIEKKVKQEITIEWKENGGKYIFTCVNIFLDNERIEYLGYKAETKEIEESSSRLLDYMRNHIFATIIIFIIILFVCGMICNIIRIDRKPKRQTVEKIEVDKIMEDM